MRLVKFEIWNFRSIQKSGEIYLSNDITVLAWKNESGKSTALDALYEFNNWNKELWDDSKPVWWDDSRNTRHISCWFQLTDSEISKLLEEAWDEDMLSSMTNYFNENKDGFFIWKTAVGYWFYIAFYNAVRSTWNNQLKILIDEISIFWKEYKLHLENLGKGNESYIHFKQQINKTFEKWNSSPISERSEFWKISAFIADKKIVFENIKSECDSQFKIIEDKILWFIPEIVLYREFDRWLEYEMTIEEAKNNSSFQDFCTISGISLERLQRMNRLQDKRTYLKKRSADITGIFNEYWQQEKIILQAAPNWENITFSILEEWMENHELMFSQRSEWFKWFFDFYLKMQASWVTDDDSQSKIILIDEPGLHLHAKAQNDVLNVLKDLSDKHQIIISTHSPYLIDAHYLERVRLVHRDIKKWTYVTSINTAKGDKETITPIYTAIGLSLNVGITRKNTVVTEWLSDYYYLLSFAKILKKNETTTSFLPSVGVTNIPLLISLLYGFGNWEYKVVLDSDEAWEEIKASLINNGVDEVNIVSVSDESGVVIEDLFSREDFNTLILAGTDLTVPDWTTNWTFLLAHSELSKPLLAKKFNEASKRKITISQETQDNFSALLDKLSFWIETEEVIEVKVTKK